MPTPPVQSPYAEADQLKVQPVRFDTVWLVAGSAPAPEQKELSTVVPSDCVQVTLRVSMAVVEQLLESALQEPVLQL